MDEKKVPKLRFEGFVQDWEQRKLGEVADEFKSGYSIKAENIFDKGEYPVYGGNGIRGFTDTFNHDGEFALIGRQGALSGNMNFSTNKAYFTEHAIAVRANNMNDTRFLYFLLCKLQLGRWVTQSAQPGLAVGTLVEIRIQVPGKAKEQQKVGNFFKKLDDTIALHQDKLNKLKQLKKGFLQVLFANETTIPKIRFANFTEEWEQRKLSDVASIVGGGTPSTSNPEYWEGDIDWYAPAEIGDQIYVNKSLKTITELGQQKSSAKILPIGTVLFTSRAGIGNTAILAKEGTTNQGFQSIVPHENKLDSYFIFSRTHELKRYGEVTGAGSTFAEVSGKQLAKMPILIPCIDEQRKIGAFFEQLDNTIALHQNKLKILKQLKKSFLQKMFI
ncbi:restriction endonuclease subunit S [Enterococcus durans]|uniref:restriction endonuclease subunit S n=1 Tax=Enterococcus durans TaxID=53345 RepID=UPI00188421DA|nr:restriction endonuclease subunit S [Enterococcus durans]MBE9887702.1 restriction endonuclease subunit S [Enterococcus durans]